MTVVRIAVTAVACTGCGRWLADDGGHRRLYDHGELADLGKEIRRHLTDDGWSLHRTPATAAGRLDPDGATGHYCPGCWQAPREAPCM